MRLSSASSMALLTSANAATTTLAASITATGPSQSTMTSIFRIPYFSGIPLQASVVNSEDDAITYRLDCDQSHPGSEDCNLYGASATVIKTSTYKATQTSKDISIGVNCVVQSHDGLSCEMTESMAPVTWTEYDYTRIGTTERTITVTTHTDPGIDTSVGNIMTTSRTFSSSELFDLTVRVTGGLEKLASATATATTTGTGAEAATTSTINGMPKMTGNANLLAGGAMAALALAL